MKKFNLIFLTSNKVLVSQRQYSDWYEIQNEFDDYMSNVDFDSINEIKDYIKSDYKLTEEKANEELKKISESNLEYVEMELQKMEFQECNLNIRYDLSKEIWDKVPLIYERMDGWIGFGKDGKGESGIPYWFSYYENEKSIYASVEPSGLHFVAKMDLNEWNEWKAEIKKIATEVLEFKVGEIEKGEVGHEIEWLKKPNIKSISNNKWWEFWK